MELYNAHEDTGTHAIATVPVLSDEVWAVIRDELSPATQRAYQQALSGLNAYYAEHEWEMFPDEPDRFVAQFLDYLNSLAAAGLSHSTINKAVAAFRWQVGYTRPSYVGWLGARPVKAFLVGVAKRQKARKVRKAEALTLTQLESVYSTLSRPSTPRNQRDRAMVALGVATALRASSLAALTLGDVVKASTMDGLLVEVRSSKTDQLGRGAFIPVKRSSNRKLDPVRMTLAWIDTLRAHGFSDPDCPLFPRIHGSINITSEPFSNADVAVSRVLRDALLGSGAVGFDEVEAYSSHSLRSTFITLSSQAGVAESEIAQVSGHKSMAVLRAYDRSTVERFAQTAYLGD